MSEDFDHSTEPLFSAFWPLLIIVTGFFIWFAIQDYELNNQRSALNKQLQAAVPTINEAQNINTRYVALMKDLVQTAQKDQAAAEIVKAAIQAGLIHVQPNATGGTNATPNPAEPAATGTK